METPKQEIEKECKNCKYWLEFTKWCKRKQCFMNEVTPACSLYRSKFEEK